MPEKTESQILAECFEDVRSLTKFYLSRTEGIDPYHAFSGEGGVAFNSLYWLVGHLVWAEHYLLYEAMTGKRLDIPWIESFDNALPEDRSALPSEDELMDAMDRVHAEAMAVLTAMDAAALDEPNQAGLQLRAGNTKRVVVRHAIRHEPTHTGQIGWILKMAGKETV